MAMKVQGGRMVSSGMSNQALRNQTIPRLVQARVTIGAFAQQNPTKAQARAALTKLNDVIELLGRV